MIQQHDFEDNHHTFLLFRLCGGLYGTPLLGVREVVEFQQPKPVPNTLPHFLGVVNIRGEILGVLDLGLKMDLRAQENPPGQGGTHSAGVKDTHPMPHARATSPGLAMLIFDTPQGPLAAVVDKVEAVISLQEADLEKKPNLHSEFPLEYFIGIGKSRFGLSTLVLLDKIVAIEEIVSFREAQNQQAKCA